MLKKGYAETAKPATAWGGGGGVYPKNFGNDDVKIVTFRQSGSTGPETVYLLFFFKLAVKVHDKT